MEHCCQQIYLKWNHKIGFKSNHINNRKIKYFVDHELKDNVNQQSVVYFAISILKLWLFQFNQLKNPIPPYSEDTILLILNLPQIQSKILLYQYLLCRTYLLQFGLSDQELGFILPLQKFNIDPKDLPAAILEFDFLNSHSTTRSDDIYPTTQSHDVDTFPTNSKVNEYIPSQSNSDFHSHDTYKPRLNSLSNLQDQTIPSNSVPTNRFTPPNTNSNSLNHSNNQSFDSDAANNRYSLGSNHTVRHIPETTHANESASHYPPLDAPEPSHTQSQSSINDRSSIVPSKSHSHLNHLKYHSHLHSEMEKESDNPNRYPNLIKRPSILAEGTDNPPLKYHSPNSDTRTTVPPPSKPLSTVHRNYSIRNMTLPVLKSKEVYQPTNRVGDLYKAANDIQHDNITDKLHSRSTVSYYSDVISHGLGYREEVAGKSGYVTDGYVLDNGICGNRFEGGKESGNFEEIRSRHELYDKKKCSLGDMEDDMTKRNVELYSEDNVSNIPVMDRSASNDTLIPNNGHSLITPTSINLTQYTTEIEYSHQHEFPIDTTLHSPPLKPDAVLQKRKYDEITTRV